MCGVCGLLLVSARSDAKALEAEALRMAATLRHRGPDASGTWVDETRGIALGHRRLSILDLSEQGAQPMQSACGRYVLSYNGELYDTRELRPELESLGHRFRGHSDTEVLVEAISAWGVERALARSNGMFAFAVWDRERARLTLARDRIGKKPLYYGFADDALLFGSELKALRAHPGFRDEIDRDALAFFVQYSYIPAPHTIFRHARKLAPGTLLELEPGVGPGAATPRPWWSATEVLERGEAEPFEGSRDDAVAALHELLRDAVARRAIADVPLGALLSGGIDSTLVVALLQAQSGQPVRTFCIGYTESDHDEARHARAVAEHLGTRHRELIVTPEDARGVVPDLPRIYDEPFADTSQIPTVLVSRLAREDVTVALSGDGGDELFAGYERYRRCLARGPWLARLPAPLREAVAGGLRATARAGAPGAGEAAGAWQRAAGRLDRVAESFDAAGVRELFLRANGRCDDPSAFVPGATLPASVLTDPGRRARLSDPLAWMMGVDLCGHLAEDILVKVDRASMSVGLEVRCPILDARVVELAARLPASHKVVGGVRKWPLRRILDRYVPHELVERPKQGFGMPIGAWLRGPLRTWADDLLAESRLRRQGLLEPAAVRAVWEQHRSGWRDRRFLLWNLLVFQAWLAASEPPPRRGDGA